jgi:hypothetical protein
MELGTHTGAGRWDSSRTRDFQAARLQDFTEWKGKNSTLHDFSLPPPFNWV